LHAFTIARVLGCFVEDVLENMSAREFAEWGVVLTSKPEELQSPATDEEIAAAFTRAFGEAKPLSPPHMGEKTL
jgi:hypothetical protein